jgi:hypothetical protein
MDLTEKDAAIAFAKAWNRLNASEFLQLLDEDAHYASQWVFDELTSKNAIADYLTEKMQTVKRSGSKVYAELGNTRSGFSGRDCVFMAQGKGESIQAVALFEVLNGKIRRYDLCIPELLDVERTGVYPIEPKLVQQTTRPDRPLRCRR